MKSIVIAAGLLIALAGFSAGPADAAGCIKGAWSVVSPVIMPATMGCLGRPPAA